MSHYNNLQMLPERENIIKDYHSEISLTTLKEKVLVAENK